MFLRGVPTHQITWELLERCREEGDEESRTLDFTRQGPDLYTGETKTKRDFLEAVCGFANAGGGVLLLGVEEKRVEGRKQRTIAALPGVTFPKDKDFADYKSRLEDVVKGSLDPRFAGLRVSGVKGPNDELVVSVGVERSAQAPHRVNAYGSREFMLRMMTSTERMEVDEIRHAFRRSLEALRDAESRLVSTIERVKNDSRAKRQATGQNGVDVAALWIGVFPIYPDALLFPISSQEVSDALLGLRDTHSEYEGVRVGYDHLGAFLESNPLTTGGARPIDRVLRDGGVERWDRVRRKDTKMSGDDLVDALVKGFEAVKQLRGRLGIIGSALVTVGVLGGVNAVVDQVYRRDRGPRLRPEPGDRPLSSNAIFVPTEESSDEFFGPLVKRVADFFWQSSGHQFCGGVDEEGRRAPGL